MPVCAALESSDRLPEDAASFAVTVGQTEGPFASVRRSNACGGKVIDRPLKARSGEAFVDLGKGLDDSWNILEEEHRGLAFDEDSEDVRPEMALVGCAESLSGGTERLTGEARSDEIHRATPSSAVEGANVVPDRCATQGRVFHPRHDNGRGVGFPLDVTHSSILGVDEFEAEFEAGNPGT